MKDKKKIKKIISWVIYIAVLVVLIYGIPKGLSYTLKTPYPMAAITSSSMWPNLKQGDLVLIKGVENYQEIKEGDIIVYENEKGFTIHRVIQISDNFLVTKGDANNTADSPIRYEEVIGKALTFNDSPIRIPKLGLVSIFINNKKI